MPSILENLFQVLVGFTDTYFIGTIGTNAIVGVSATNLLMNIYIAFYLAVGIGATALLTRSFGVGDKPRAIAVLQQSIIMTSFISIFLVLLNLIYSIPLLGMIGHADGIKRMYQEGKDCSDILIQISAVRSALNNVGKLILKDHINHCIKDAIEQNDEESLEKLHEAINKFLK